MPGRSWLAVLLLLGLALGAAGDFAALESRRVQPRELEPGLPPACADGLLRVVNWNVHRFRGPDRQGARYQEHQILEELDEQRADIYLLQEVPPGREQATVDALGMPGYQSLTLPDKSSLVVLHPGLRLLSNRRVWLFPRPAPADEAAAVQALEAYQRYSRDQLERQYWEPRAAQVLTLETPSGQRFRLFHVHLTSGPEDFRIAGQPTLGEVRLEQARHLRPWLDEGALPVVGGGDLNGLEVASLLHEWGFRLEGRGLDWLGARGATLVDVDVQTLRDETNDEIRLSDHPLLRGVYRLPAAIRQPAP